LVEEVLSLEQSLALTGKNPQDVANIMSYLNYIHGNGGYIKRRYNTNRPASVDERIVQFGANSDSFCFLCDINTSSVGASFGVRFSQKDFKA